MALPGPKLVLLNGQLGSQAPSAQNTLVYLGVSTGGDVGGLTFYGDPQAMRTDLGAGEVLEAAAYNLAVAGGSVGVLGLNPSVQGGVSAVTHTGTGANTITVSIAPHRTITIACSTSGTLGTAAFTFQLDSDPASPSVVSQSAWSSTGYRVPGTYCVVEFTAGSYVGSGTPDVYVISTAGAVTHPAGSGPAVPTYLASPIDDFNPAVLITTGGALQTAQFTYSLDGTAANMTGAIVTPASTYVLPGTGLVLTFGGSMQIGDAYAFAAAGPGYGNTDLQAALTLLETTYLSSSYTMALVVGNLSSAANWVTQCATLETAGLALFNAGVYVRFLNGAPTVGTVTGSSGSIVVNSAATDTALQTSRLSVSAPHVGACAGDEDMTSAISGLTFRRNLSWGAGARCSLVEASENIGAVADGAVPSVTALYRNETVTPGLDAVGFITMRSFPGSVSTGTGLTGFYITNGHTMDSVTSDYYPLANARVVDLACAVAKASTLPLTLAKIPTKNKPGYPGVITELRAQQIEGAITTDMETALVNARPQNAVAASATVNRFNNVLATSQLIVAVAVQPFAYATTILVYLGLALSA